MATFFTPIIIEQRALGQLHRMVLYAPDLAAGARAGHYLLVRCADSTSFDPLLRRSLFIAGVDRSQGTVTLFFVPDERGVMWLAQRCKGSQLNVFGPLGAPFTIQHNTHNLLLVGAGAGIGALWFLAHEAVAHGQAVVLLAAAPAIDVLPPPFLLPTAVEYQASADGETAVLALLEAGTAENISSASQFTSQSPLIWADQLCIALPRRLLPHVATIVQSAKLRWQNGFAQALLSESMPCGIGVCYTCLEETRSGLRARCKDGPVFDLREL